MSKEELSVRARHKLHTASSIHDIAVTSVLAHGLADTKIEDIAHAVGVSRRTFFNYFPTKEDAVLGLQPPSLPDGAAGRFDASDEDVLTRTVMLVIEVVRTSIVPHSSAARRKQLRARFPELSQRFEARAVAAEKIVHPIIAQSIAHGDTADTEQEINIILGLAGAIIRHAYRVDPEVKDDTIATSIQLFKITIRKRL